jgi:CRP-like cAMP-binding protein
VSILTARTVQAGTVIIRKGEPGDAMYFIVSGAVEVEAQGGKIRAHVRTVAQERAVERVRRTH